MRSTTFLASSLALAAITACGSSNNNKTDASIVGGSDAATHDGGASLGDAAPKPAGCDYAEQNDATNDDFFQNGAMGSGEQTGLTFGTTPLVICGDFNNGHFDTMDTGVDADGYYFAVATEGDTLLGFSAPGADALQTTFVQIYSVDSTGSFTPAGEADFYGDHGVTAVHLPAGTYEYDIAAINPTDAASVIHYKIKLAPDNLATRTPPVATTTATESLDNAGDGYMGNDVVDFAAADGTISLTAATTDAPETTGITAAAGTNYKVVGTSTFVTQAAASEYLDKDTFKVATGAGVDQLAIRVSWTTTGANLSDLDWYLFEDGTTNVVAESTAISTTSPEFLTIPVKPGASYWLWIGQYPPDTADGVTAGDASYTAEIYGETYTP